MRRGFCTIVLHYIGRRPYAHALVGEFGPAPTGCI